MEKKNIVIIIIIAIAMFITIGAYLINNGNQDNIQNFTAVNGNSNGVNETKINDSFNNSSTINNNLKNNKDWAKSSNKDIKLISKKQAIKIAKGHYSPLNVTISSVKLVNYEGHPCWLIKVYTGTNKSIVHISAINGEILIHYSPHPHR